MERRFRVHSDRIKLKAGEVLSKSSANIRLAPECRARIYPVSRCTNLTHDFFSLACRALAPKSPRVWASDRERERERDRPEFATNLLDVGDDTGAEGGQKGNKERRLIAEKELRKFKAKVRPNLSLPVTP